MSKRSEDKSIQPQQDASSNGVGIVLGEDALVSLTNYFDVLIQMDLEQQNNEGDSNESESKTSKNQRGSEKLH